MDRKSYKKAYKEAVEQLSDEQTKQIKDLVKQGLEKLQAAEKERQAAVKKIQLLKKDLEDLREGRLDQIEERHLKDKDADKLSPISPQTLEKIIILQIPQPTYNNYPQYGNTWTTDGITWTSAISTSGISTSFSSFCGLNGNGLDIFPLSNYSSSLAIGQATVGTYLLDDGTVKYL